MEIFILDFRLDFEASVVCELSKATAQVVKGY